MSKNSISGRSLNNSITSEDILGKEVIDVKGKVIGIVEKVLIDPKKIEIIGIEIDKGFLKQGLAIGKGYIDKITEVAVILNTKVAYEIKGMTVFDSNGAKVGFVSGIDLIGKRNKVKNLHVKKNIYAKEIIISHELIETIGHNVILNVKKKTLLKK